MNEYATTSTGPETYSYRYPFGKNGWKPGSKEKLNERMCEYVRERARIGLEPSGRRRPAFKKIEDNLTGYIKMSAEDRQVKEQDELLPTSMVVPELAAAVDSIMTYLYTLYAVDQVFELTATKPEDEIGALLLEADLHSQMQNADFGNLEALYAHWRSSVVYGYGVVTPQWTRNLEYKRRLVTTPSIFSLDETSMQRTLEIAVEGNKLVAIHPRLYFCDPNVPIHKPQEGEFCGFLQRTNLPALLEEEDDPFSGLFNVRYLQNKAGNLKSALYESAMADKAEDNSTTWINPSTSGSSTTCPVDLTYLFCKLNPRKLKIGDHDGIERWMIVMAGNDTIVYAEPLDLDHNQFPVCVTAPDSNGFDISPVSRTELVLPIQQFLSWMFNAIVAGTREGMRARIAFDPGIFSEADVFSSKPNHPIRVRRALWGRGVKDGIEFITSPNIAQNLLQQTSDVTQMLQRGTGATDLVQGLRRQTSEKVSATEAQGVQNQALSRLHMLALRIGQQSLRPLGRMMAKQTQQFRERAGWEKTSGRMREYLLREQGIADPSMYVSPEMLQVDYDLIIKDPTMPQAQNLQAWQFIFQTLSTSPIGANYDLNRIFMYLARLAGATNVQEFLNKTPVPMVGSPQQVEQAASSPNVIPFNGVGNVGNV